MASSNKKTYGQIRLGLAVFLLCFALGFLTRYYGLDQRLRQMIPGTSPSSADTLPLLDGDDLERQQAMEEAKKQGKNEYEYTTKNPPAPLKGAAP